MKIAGAALTLALLSGCASLDPGGYYSTPAPMGHLTGAVVQCRGTARGVRVYAQSSDGCPAALAAYGR